MRRSGLVVGVVWAMLAVMVMGVRGLALAPSSQVNQLYAMYPNERLSPSGMRLGDVLAALGKPDFQETRYLIQGRELRTPTTLRLFFITSRRYVIVRLEPGTHLTPAAEVVTVIHMGTPLPRTDRMQAWAGYGWMMPEFLRCSGLC